MKIFNVIPIHVKRLFARLSIILTIMTLTRIIFYVANQDQFASVDFADFLAGIWMDCITIGIWFIPFYTLALLPLPFTKNTFYQVLLKAIFMFTSVIMIGLNLLDVEYFKYTAKRSTSDLFTIVSAGNDINQLLGTFLKDFWWLLLLFLLLIITLNWLYNKTVKIGNATDQFNYLRRTIHFLFFGLFLFVVGRGGFGYRPADMMTASQLTKPANTALVLNTPLSIIKTIGKASLIERPFFEENNKNIYNPFHKNNPDQIIKENANIMVIILESFGNEWMGLQTGKKFTPFLDSLLNESLYFTNGWANGKKSIEAVPAIFASIPSLLDNPYVSSHYGTNQIASLPELLKEKGYESAFYHGATNGSMKFDVFSAHAGFDHYFGRTEYNNEEHSDDVWGILDEYFLPWTARSITTELKEPFVAGLFSISSHHPYYVPEKYRSELPKDKEPMGQSIAYTDMSLKLFFEEAKKQPWYDNTVYVICADHTPASKSLRYSQRVGMYQIPIAIFDPTKKLQPKKDSTIFNQMDIMPTVLDLVGYNKEYYAFGNSYYDTHNIPFAINYIENTYHFTQGNYMINFVHDKVTGLFNYKNDPLMYHDSLQFYSELSNSMEKRLKGIIQRYNNDLIHNTMTVK